jgi:hypothetical protein
MAAQVDEVTGSAQSLSEMAKDLLHLVAQFRLAEDEAGQLTPQSPSPAQPT